MHRTTPLAPIVRIVPMMTVRNILVLTLLLMTAACGSKQFNARQTLAVTPEAPDFATSFQPSSPFVLDGGLGQFCALPTNKLVSHNPFMNKKFGSASSQRLLALAFSQIGTLYRPGGVEPATGFDCSGFTTWVYSKLGVNLPRSSREQYQEGKVIAKTQLRKGDLVFFGSKKRITHVGIYLEDNKFIHSSSSGDTVKISSLDDPTWERKYSGARRVF